MLIIIKASISSLAYFVRATDGRGIINVNLLKLQDIFSETVFIWYREYLMSCSNHDEDWQTAFVKVLNVHAAKKGKVLRRNHQPHIKKVLRKSNMNKFC